MVGLNSAWRMLRSLLQWLSIGEFGQLLRGEGQGPEGEGKGLGLIRPSIAPTSFFWWSYFRVRVARLIVAAGPSSGFLYSATGANAFFNAWWGRDTPRSVLWLCRLWSTPSAFSWLFPGKTECGAPLGCQAGMLAGTDHKEWREESWLHPKSSGVHPGSLWEALTLGIPVGVPDTSSFWQHIILTVMSAWHNFIQTSLSFQHFSSFLGISPVDLVLFKSSSLWTWRDYRHEMQAQASLWHIELL